MIIIIKGEIQFGENDFGSQIILSDKDTLVQLLLNVLFMRPGQLPSMPHIGINIRHYLYSFDDEIDCDEIKTKINEQCSFLTPYMELVDIQTYVVDYKGQPVIMIIIPVYISGEKESLILGISKNTESNKVTFNYKFDKNIF